MNSLKDILEGLLSQDFDISDDDVKPIKQFVEMYKSKTPRFGHRFIKGGWTVEEMDTLLRSYGEHAGTVQSIDREKFFKDARSKKQTLVVVSPYSPRPEFYILVPEGRRRWMFYTCDSDYYDSSLFKGFARYDDELKEDIVFTSRIPSKVYRLRDDSFLKDLQKYLA